VRGGGVARLANSALGASHQYAPSADDVSWQLKGLCRMGDYDPQVWTPDPPKVEAKSREAVRLCHKCPVIEKCREWALSNHEEFGVWGGLTENERAVIWGEQLPGRIRRDHSPLVNFYRAEAS
jgi:WhiB family redox-sensing transcriptional regulator